MIKSILIIVPSVLGIVATSWAQEKMTPSAVDTPSTTVLGNPFIAPKDWRLSVKGAATFIEAPEGGSRLVLVDVQADSDTVALSKGWAAYKKLEYPLTVATERADGDGWSKQRRFEYQTSPNEKRSVKAGVMFANDVWTVAIMDMAQEVREKRLAQINLVFSSLVPKGYSRESFANQKAHELDEARMAQLSDYLERAIKITGVPGIGLGIVQNGRVVFAGGFGVRELGKKERVEKETLFIVASNTKAMTTLLLAKLADAGKLTWKTPVTELMSTFRLGSDETTKRTLVEHLVCACTGLPRKDMEMFFEFGGVMPMTLMQRLAETEPTSGFGEIYQYSNSLAAAAGYVAGHVLFPELEIGQSYDLAMQTEVFDPLEMQATTFDYENALAANHASAHWTTANGETGLADMGIYGLIFHARPAGGAWSNVNDMLKYIEMELKEGVLPNGERYLSKEALFERRVPKVAISEHAVYGMGLKVDKTYGVEVVHHGGDLIGHHSDMMWFPEHGVGAVVLTNGDPGWLIRNGFRRKLLEVLFDGKPEADEQLALESKRYFEQIAAKRKLYTLPAASDASAKLASHYINDSLGRITVQRNGKKTVFDFGEWKSEVASQKNPDGTISFIAIDSAVLSFSFEFVMRPEDETRLIFRDAQHEYVFKRLDV